MNCELLSLVSRHGGINPTFALGVNKYHDNDYFIASTTDTYEIGEAKDITAKVGINYYMAPRQHMRYKNLMMEFEYLFEYEMEPIMPGDGYRNPFYQENYIPYNLLKYNRLRMKRGYRLGYAEYLEDLLDYGYDPELYNDEDHEYNDSCNEWYYMDSYMNYENDEYFNHLNRVEAY